MEIGHHLYFRQRQETNRQVIPFSYADEAILTERYSFIGSLQKTNISEGDCIKGFQCIKRIVPIYPYQRILSRHQVNKRIERFILSFSYPDRIDATTCRFESFIPCLS